MFVGNLNFETASDDLRELFSEVGEVAQVSVPTDRMTGRPRGFAFVEFADEAHATEAIQKFDGFELGGRKLRVNEAADRDAPGGGAGGGFGRPFGAPAPARRPPRPKGSRRNARSRKRSIW